jgi:hypothetical protein
MCKLIISSLSVMVTNGRKRETNSIDHMDHGHQDRSCVPWISACNPESDGPLFGWIHPVRVFGGVIPHLLCFRPLSHETRTVGDASQSKASTKLSLATNMDATRIH